MLNHVRFRNGIQLEPSYATDPTEGLVGDMYFNSVSKKIRLCVQSTPTVKWSDVSIAVGTTDFAPLTWSASQNAWVENSEMSLNSNTLSTHTANLILEAPNATSGSNLNGKSVVIQAGSGDGTGLKGSVQLKGHSLLTSIGHADDPTLGVAGEIYYNETSNSYKYYDGTVWKALGGGSGSGFYKVVAHDASDTTLPSIDSPTIDSYAVQEGDEILFTNLSTTNNVIYKATNVSSGITWTEVAAFNSTIYASKGDTVIVQNGTWASQIGVFTGSSWSFSEKRRQFAGLNYFEESAIYAAQIVNDTNDVVFSVGKIGSEYCIVDYSIKRGVGREVGQLFITHDGVNAIVTGSNGELAPTGVLFSAGIALDDLVLYYVADNSGSDGEIKFSLKRWSDAPGGPEGPPSYTASVPSAPAAGAAGQIQFSDGANLTASANFKINSTDNALEIGTMQILPLVGPVTLNDNTASSTTIFSFPKIWEFVEVEYSAERDTNRRRGRFFIVNNGTSANIYESYVELSPMNLIFSVSLSGSNVNVEYISSPNGFDSSFKYTVMRWQ